jgi:protoporphyrinogen oxidase
MAQTKSPKASEYDSIVIGGGLSGLLVAHQLEETGRKIALIDAFDVLGGSSRPLRSLLGEIDHGFPFFPSSNEADQSLEWLSSVLQKPIESKLLDAPPITFDNGRFQPFVGFGEQATEAGREWEYYLRPNFYQLNSQPKDWVKTLAQTFTGDVFLQSHITNMTVEDGFIVGMSVNGVKHFSADQVIFAAHPQMLASFLPDSALAARTRQKMLKGTYYTAIYLDLIHHGQVTDNPAMHLLRGANEEPCIGQFYPPTELAGETVQASKWMTLIPADMTEDAELAATALKKIKRQIKRAYPQALDGQKYERISVAPASHGHLDIELENNQLPKLPNLWICSRFFGPERNSWANIVEAKTTVQATKAAEPIVEPSPNDRPTTLEA